VLRGVHGKSILGHFEEIIVPLSEGVKFDERTRQIRGAGRVNSRVRVAIEWQEAGKDFRAEGYTIDTSSKGCMVVLPQAVPVGEPVRIVNLINQLSCDATVVWRGHQSRDNWELGLELGESSFEFWGLEF
jgi:hypothetical protein